MLKLEGMGAGLVYVEVPVGKVEGVGVGKPGAGAEKPGVGPRFCLSTPVHAAPAQSPPPGRFFGDRGTASFSLKMALFRLLGPLAPGVVPNPKPDPGVHTIPLPASLGGVTFLKKKLGWGREAGG